MTRALFVIVGVLTAGLLTLPLAAQDEADKPAKPARGKAATAAEREKQLQIEKAAAQPGAVHQALAKRAGQYATEIECRAAPDAEPLLARGTATLSMELDGRFLREESEGELMGRPARSIHLLGYNTAAKQYEAVWTWTNSTAILVLKGTSTDDGQTIELTGGYDFSGEPRKMRVTTRFIDENRFVVDVYGKGPGDKEFVVVRTTYTRAK